MAIAYLANSFPEAVEAYVWEEICELRRQGQRVVPCAVRRPSRAANTEAAREATYVFPLRAALCLRASFDCLRHFPALKEFLARAIADPEPLGKRMRALVHTWLGVYFAALLRDRSITHIHVHHGYFGSWIGMVAARILGTPFSLTLHGSDLLVRADYLDVKLRNCKFCVTISDFNRRHILAKYPQIASGNIFVHRMGIDVSKWAPRTAAQQKPTPLILSVGRLHPVKNHSFLIHACSILKKHGVNFQCAIAGDGEERTKLEAAIRSLGLQDEVTLLGQVAREDLPGLYEQARVVILTSLSEGIPVTLMEAMAMEKLVVAPRITGIPELVEDGKTGFLYRPNSPDDCVKKLRFALSRAPACEQITKAARDKIENEFNSAINLPMFAADFLERVGAPAEPVPALTGNAHENSVLQQI